MTEYELLRTSLGVEGWACAHVLDSDFSGSSRVDHSCCAFGGRGGYGDDPGSLTSGSSSDLVDDEHNAQVMSLVTALGSNGAGRRAIIKAVAGQQGIVEDDELERLYSGTSELKPKAPKYVRQAMINVGLEGALAPVKFAHVRRAREHSAQWRGLERH